MRPPVVTWPQVKQYTTLSYWMRYTRHPYSVQMCSILLQTLCKNIVCYWPFQGCQQRIWLSPELRVLEGCLVKCAVHLIPVEDRVEPACHVWWRCCSIWTLQSHQATVSRWRFQIICFVQSCSALNVSANIASINNCADIPTYVYVCCMYNHSFSEYVHMHFEFHRYIHVCSVHGETDGSGLWRSLRMFSRCSPDELPGMLENAAASRTQLMNMILFFHLFL